MPTAEPAGQPLRPALTAEQERALVDATAALLRSAVSAGRNAPFSVDLPAGGGEQRVGGAFVSFKRGQQLRAVGGNLGQPIPLARAVELAAARALWEDERFPPVSATELAHLDMEIWLLHSIRQVEERGEDRVRAIDVSRHGVQVLRGPFRGLVLPGVARDNGWDARRLLDQACLKADTYPTAWQDDDTALFTFEATILKGRASGAIDAPPAAGRPPVCRPEDLTLFADFCRRELAHVLGGSTPSYYCWGAPDGNVTGVVLALNRVGSANGLQFTQFALRHGVPLQSTLFALVQAAAQALAAQRVRPEMLDALEIKLLVLDDPIMHGTVAAPELVGLDPRHRALLIVERNKAGLVFRPDAAAGELLSHTATQAQVSDASAATVYSLTALANAAPINVSTAPRPVRGPALRPAAAAGTLYDADAEALSQRVDQLLAGERSQEPWPAALVPHGELKHSGRIAAAVLKRVRIPQTVIVIGPKHTGLGMDWAVASHQTWTLPGFQIEADWLLARQLCAAIPGLELDAAAHQREHAIEVELPLLARLSPTTKVVGIAVGPGDRESCRRFAAGLADVLRQREDRPLLLVSSDMNHFAPAAATRRLDALALAALERCDPAELYETVTQRSISMCGVVPAVIVLETLRLLGLGNRAERVAYGTSADSTGDISRVVGYAGMLFG